jgi:CheY-like chemotaxis protein
MSPRRSEQSAPTPITPETFAIWVREALAHLYDSAYLRNHPLAQVLLTADDLAAANCIQKLRRALLDAIESLRPSAHIPADSPDWNAYHILELRYIEGLNPAEIINELAVSRSKFFQDQAHALDRLTDALWSLLPIQPSTAAAVEGDDTYTRSELIQSESQRVKASAGDETLDLVDVLEDLEAVVAPLAASQGSAVAFQPGPAALPVRANRVMLRQALLNLLAYAVKTCAGGQVEVEAYGSPPNDQGGERGIIVDARPAAAIPGGLGLSGGLAVSAELAAAMGGHLTVQETEGAGWRAMLALPAAPARVVLLVDDNQGLIELFRRYLTGHNWQVLSALSGGQALELAHTLHPTVIMLDVMMPEADGWETLMALKRAPETQDIAVIICSVVNEPDLARSLGAAGSITKPVTQEALLAALSRWH